MKKALLSLILAFVCLPNVFAQADAGRVFVTLDTATCTPFRWVDSVTYSADTNVTYIRHDTIFVLVYHRMTAYNHTSSIYPVREVIGECAAHWDDSVWTTPGTFRDTMHSVGGCDSIVRIKIVLAKLDSVKTITACGDYTAPWGTVYTEDVEIDTTVTSVIDTNCTYNYTLTLTVNPEYEDSIHVTAGCYYIWNKDTITDFKVHTKTLETVSKCDSIVHLNVTTYSGHQDHVYDSVVCDSIIWYKDIYNTSGVYYKDSTYGRYATGDDTATAACAHHDTLYLTIVNSVTDTALVPVIDIQAGCFYKWGDSTIVDTNVTHYQTFHTALGKCDSLASVRVISYSGHEYDTTFARYCGQPYKWKSYNSNLPGNANLYNYKKDTIVDVVVEDTVKHCTSHYTLDLQIVKKTKENTQKVCGDAYTFSYKILTYAADGTLNTTNATAVFDTNGIYAVDTTGDSLYTVDGSKCVTVNTINLNIKHPEQRYRSQDTVTITGCNAINNFKFNKKRIPFTESCDTVLRASSTTFAKCYDSIVMLKVIVKKSVITKLDTTVCDEFYWNVDSNVYNHTTTKSVKTGVNPTTGCMDSVQLKLTVNYTPVVTIDGDWALNLPNDGTTLHASADQPITKWRWYINNVQSSTVDSVVVPPVTQNTDVRLEATSNKNCTATNWITVTANVMGIDNAETLQATIYPNPTSRYLNIESAEGISEVTVYNAVGQQAIVRKGNGNHIQLDLGGLASGSYTLRILGNDGNYTSRKFIVNK